MSDGAENGATSADTSDPGAAPTDARDPTRVAIACQGGGSHTAFTAGVLRTLLREWDDEYELVGISGTSGGAFNALAVWYGLVTADRSRAADILTDLWADLTARRPDDRWLNDWLTAVTRLESAGLGVPQLSPYQLPGSDVGRERIRSVLEGHVDFDAIPDLCAETVPELVVGTVDVNGGVFETFTNEDVTTEAVLASAAVPTLFEAVELGGHAHWDGLFSQNPPVDDLLTVDADRKPHELWVVQINPQVRETVPETVDEIADRRNELSGNISLNQELRFVERVNQWIDEGHLPADRFARTDVHRIEIGRRYPHWSKLDRRPAFVAELLELGDRRAREFLRERADPSADADSDPATEGERHPSTDPG